MFRTKSKVEIGNFLTNIIDTKYKSNRQFCIAYLYRRDGDKPDADVIQNMANRICQIKKGNKEIQIEDLPIFSELLDVSIEEILSAGTYVPHSLGRTTNYSIAFSDNPNEWEKYIQRNDKLFLNPDEYNKTVIDYALENGNYAFLKYLMKKKYIWFTSDNQKDYVIGFGAGTSIERRKIDFTDPLDVMLKESDDLRYKMIALAIEHGDFDMLDTLHAREIPELYNMTNVLHLHFVRKDFSVSKNLRSMIQSIANCKDDRIIDYFFKEFRIKANYGNSVNTYIFPYAGLLLNELIKSQPKKAKKYLDKALKYNNSINQKLLQAVDESYKRGPSRYNINPALLELHPDIKKQWEKTYDSASWQDYYFYPDKGILSYVDLPYEKHAPIKGFITNVIKVTAKSSDKEIQAYINKINALYNGFSGYLKNKE